jgi:hypothetical protein
LKQRRKNEYLLSQFPHPSSSPNTEELAGWNVWPQRWSRPSRLFLLQGEEQKQWPHMILSIQQLAAAQRLLTIRPKKISYEQSYNQHADQPYNNK